MARVPGNAQSQPATDNGLLDELERLEAGLTMAATDRLSHVKGRFFVACRAFNFHMTSLFWLFSVSIGR